MTGTGGEPVPNLAVYSWLQHSPATYSAWVAGIALAATITAAVVAFGQFRLARDTRLKQAQPSVVAFESQSGVDQTVIELVIKNFGPTPAYDVRVLSTPTLQRTGQNPKEISDVWLPDVIPMLAPGQEWRTVWDFAQHRFENGTLDERHEVTITYADWLQNPLSSRSILDWGANKDRHYIETFTVHSLTQTMRKIEKLLREWNNGVGSKGIDVWVRDGIAKDEADAARQEEQSSARAAYLRFMSATEPPAADPEL